MSTPLTTIKVCSGVRLDNSYKHSIYFSSLLDQKAYFETKVAQIFTAYSYCRKNWSIKLHATIAKARTWSYLFFDNPEDLKTYFYFITDVQYINDETVEVFLELDVLQTYFFETRFAPCFVERETPRSDEYYEHTLDEGLDVGHLTVNASSEIEGLEELSVLCMSSVDLNTFDDTLLGHQYGEVYSGVQVYATDETPTKISQVLSKLSEDNKLDAIVSMWVYPKLLISEGGMPENAENTTFKIVGGAMPYEWSDDATISTVEGFVDGYTPRNNKLFSYPYSFIHVSNNNGASADYRYERFTNGKPRFVLYGSALPDGAVKLIPCNYNGEKRNHEEALTLSGYPTCAWTGDTYKIWLAQNQNQHKVAEVSSGISIGAGVAMTIAGVATMNPMLMGGGATMAGGGIMGVASQLAQKEDMKTYPPQAHGVQNASVNAVNGQMNFTVYYKTVSREIAKVIDDYFTVYGYKVHEVKEPSRRNRQRYTYVKTIDCSVFGDFCQEDRAKIASCFNNGVTYWTDGDQIGEYDEFNGFLD